MKKNETSARELAKAGLCAGVAGVTALSGAAPAVALADALQTPDSDVIRAAESAPQTIEQAKQALDAAKALVDEAASARDDARFDLSSATTARDDRADAASEANRVVVNDQLAITTIIDSIASDASDVVETANRTASEAQSQLAQAIAERDAAKNELDTAQALLQDAREAYDAATTNPSVGDEQQTERAIVDAQSDFEAASGERAAAENRAQAARSERDAKATQHANAQEDLDRARDARDDAENRLASKRQELANAQTRKEELEDEHATLDTDISRAQSLVDVAKTELGTAETTLEAARRKVTDTKNALDAAEAAYSEALRGLDPETEAKRKQAESAKQSWQDAADTATSIQGELKEAEAPLEEYQAQIDEAERRVQAAQKAYDDADAEVTRLQEELFNAKSGPVDMRDFFVSDYDEIASSEFSSAREVDGEEHPEVVEATDPLVAGDAATYENVFESIKAIRAINAIRSKHGLAPLLVLDSLMAREIVNVNWSAATAEHAPGAGNESLVWSHESEAVPWYEAQKSVYEEAEKTNEYAGEALPENWQALDRAALEEECGDFSAAIATYLDCIDADSRYVGAAVSTKQDTLGGIVYGQLYSASNLLAEVEYDIDEWETRLTPWVVEALEKAKDPDGKIAQGIADAEAKKESAGKLINSAKNDKDATENAKSEYYDENVASIKSRLDAANANATTLYTAYTTAQGIYKAALESNQEASLSVRTTQENYERAYSNHADAGIDLTQKEADFAAAKKKLNTTGAELNRLNKAKEAIEKDQAACEKTIEETPQAIEEIESKFDKLDADIAQCATKESQLATELRALADGVTLREQELASAQAVENGSYADLLDAIQAHDDRVDANLALVYATEDLELAESEVEAREAALLVAGNEVLRAEAAINDARDALSVAIANFEHASGMTIEQALAEELDDPSLAYVKDAVERLKLSREAAQTAAEALQAAEARLDEAESAYQSAHEAWLAALATAADAQVVYDDLLAAQSADAEEPPSTPAEPSRPSAEDQLPNAPAQVEQQPSTSGPSGPSLGDAAGDSANDASIDASAGSANLGQDSQPTIADIASEPGITGAGSVVSYQPPAAPAAATYSNPAPSAYPRFAVSTPATEADAVYDEPIVDEAQAIVEESIDEDGTPLAIPVPEEENDVAGIAGGVSIAVVVGAGAAVASMKLRRRRHEGR